MPKAHVTTAHGTKITIEGDAAEVASIIGQIQTAHSNPRRTARSVKEVAEKRAHKKHESAKDHIISLKEESFFDKPKTLAEVAHKLEESGHLYPITSLSGVMLGLVQRRLISRVKRDGKWKYGKR